MLLVYRPYVEEAVVAEVRSRDPERRLRTADFSEIVGSVADRVCSRMVHVQHTALDEEDRAFIRRSCANAVEIRLRPADHRFRECDRVVCYIATRRRPWAAGTIMKLDQHDFDDPTGRTVFPYLVKVDPPNGRLVCVPRDDNDVMRAEVCFGQHADALWFSLLCKPQMRSSLRRFVAGDRVACAVEDAESDDVTWAAGTVLEVNYDAEPDARKAMPDWDMPCADGIVPCAPLSPDRHTIRDPPSRESHHLSIAVPAPTPSALEHAASPRELTACGP